MNCLWGIRGRTVQPILGAAVLVAALGNWVVGGVAPATRHPIAGRPLVEREQSLGRVPMHTSEYRPVYESSARLACGKARPPEALLTPDPALETLSDGFDVRVSFIVGADGRVHSAFVVNSGTPVENRAILDAVRLWRYRPGLCNGVPTDVEAQVLFAPR